MIRTFFLNLAVSVLLCIGFLAVYFVASMMIYYVTHWLILLFPAKMAIWIYIILSAVVAVFFLGIIFMKIYENKLGATNEISDYWSDRNKPIKKGAVIFSLFPILLISVALAVLFYFKFNSFVFALKNKTYDSMGLITIIMCWIFVIVFFVVYFFTMVEAYLSISCEKCSVVGCIDFYQISNESKVETDYKTEKYNEKVGTFQVDDRDVMDIYAEKTGYYKQQTTIRTRKYKGTCRCCKYVNKRTYTDYDTKRL